MTRRITVAMLAAILVALFVAGLTVTIVTAAQARSSSRRDLVAQASQLRGYLGLEPGGAPSGDDRVRVARAQACRNLAQAAVRPDGTVRAKADAGEVPLPPSMDLAVLDSGGIDSGIRNGVVYAAFACPRAVPRAGDAAVANLNVFVLLDRPMSGLRRVRSGVTLAALITVPGALLAAVALGRRLSRPVVSASRAATRMAAGDLSTRLDEDGDVAEMAALNRSLNHLAASLDRSRGLEQQFLLSISHDLRTPLTSIKGYAEALADGTLTDVDRGVAVIQQEAGRLERLVRDLLDLARLEARQFRLELTAVDLADVAARCVAAFANGPTAGEIRLEVGPGTARAMVRGDRDRLGQIAANLVENALKYAISSVVVDAGASGGLAWLRVSDDGPGIAAQDLPHVFERLYVAADRPVRAESGSGLGLAIVRELAQAMGGDVSAEAGTQRGTTMLVRLPAATSSDTAEPSLAQPR